MSDPRISTYTAYLTENTPRKLYWKYVAGPQHLHPIQMYDLVYDQHDMDIRFSPRNASLLRKTGLLESEPGPTCERL